MKNKVKTIIIIIVTMVLTVGLTFATIYLINKGNAKELEKKKENLGISSISETTYKLPEFAITVLGKYQTSITNLNLTGIKVYKITATISNGQIVEEHTYIGVKMQDVFNEMEFTDYEKAIFKAVNGLYVIHNKESINDQKFLVFRIDDRELTKNELVMILATDLDAKYSIPGILRIDLN